MGSGVASRLFDLGYAVSVYNRTQAAASPFVVRGARAAARPCDTVLAGGVAITSVANDEALEALTLAGWFKTGDLWVAPKVARTAPIKEIYVSRVTRI